MYNTIGYILIIIAIIPILFSFHNEHRSFFNIKTVIKDHLKIFKDCKSQYFIFMVRRFSFQLAWRSFTMHRIISMIIFQ